MSTRSPRHPATRPGVAALLLPCAVALVPRTAAAADPFSLAPIVVQAGPAATSGPAAPTTADPAATQPTSLVGARALETFVAPTGNYDDAVRLTPSVLDIAPNGPGLGEAQILTIRGFQDGQYDVTFDGIPFADSDDFTHHSSAYFDRADLSSVAVDRGPGDASTVGDATFGGTVSLRSISPALDAGSALSGSVGSDATRTGGLLLDTGTLPGGSAALLSIDDGESAGALEDVAQRRATLFGKLVLPLGDDTALTLASNLARTEQGEPLGATAAEIARFGPAFALNGNPDNQAFEGYNGSTYRTDISYAALVTSAGDWSITDRLYTYGLYRRIEQGLDPDGETPNGTALAPLSANGGDVPGQSGRNGLRAWGDILRASRPLGAGLTFEAGLWVERQHNSRFLLDIDETAGQAPNPDLSPVPGVANSAAIDRAQVETLVTAQPWLQLAWDPTPTLALTAGLKGAFFDRAVEAPVMEGTRLPTDVDRDFGAPVPSFSARLRVTPRVSVYAQVARGFLAPVLQAYDVTDPATAPIEPETTWNFQVGAGYRAPGLALSADLYDIVFDNALGTRTIGGETEDFDEGGVVYRGIEGEGTRVLGGGFSFYANGSLNQATQSRSAAAPGGPAPDTPQATLSGGLLWQRGRLHATLLDRWTGGFFGDVDRVAWIDPFNELDASAGIDVRVARRRTLTFELQAFNLLDSRKVDALAGYTVADATPLFWTQPGATLFLSATAGF